MKQILLTTIGIIGLIVFGSCGEPKNSKTKSSCFFEIEEELYFLEDTQNEDFIITLRFEKLNEKTQLWHYEIGYRSGKNYTVYGMNDETTFAEIDCSKNSVKFKWSKIYGNEKSYQGTEIYNCLYYGTYKLFKEDGITYLVNDKHKLKFVDDYSK